VEQKASSIVELAKAVAESRVARLESLRPNIEHPAPASNREPLSTTDALEHPPPRRYSSGGIYMALIVCRDYPATAIFVGREEF
jgi:hypothetical protein